jgi:hypothetical protein
VSSIAILPKLEEISESTFSQCRSSVSTLGYAAFSLSNLSSILIPSSVREVDAFSFNLVTHWQPLHLSLFHRSNGWAMLQFKSATLWDPSPFWHLQVTRPAFGHARPFGPLFEPRSQLVRICHLGVSEMVQRHPFCFPVSLEKLDSQSFHHSFRGPAFQVSFRHSRPDF